MCNRLDTIPACDRQTDGRTDGQTSCHGIVRAVDTRRAIKTKMVPFFETQCVSLSNAATPFIVVVEDTCSSSLDLQC